MKKLVTLALAASLVAVPAGADAAKYKGKTKGGSTITLKAKGNKVSKIRTAVPIVCVETTGTGQTRAGTELFQPPGSFKLGKKAKRKALQPAAINSGNKATKNYTVSVRRSGGKIKGKLKVNLSFLRLSLFKSLPDTYICSGSTTFSAK